MISMAWKGSREVPEEVKEWMTFSVCLWAAEAVVVVKNRKKELSQSPDTSRSALPISTMVRPLKSKLIDKEFALVVMVSEELMHQLFKHVPLVRVEE